MFLAKKFIIVVVLGWHTILSSSFFFSQAWAKETNFKKLYFLLWLSVSSVYCIILKIICCGTMNAYIHIIKANENIIFPQCILG